MKNPIVQKLATACLAIAIVAMTQIPGSIHQPHIEPEEARGHAMLSGTAAVQELQKDGSYQSLTAAFGTARYHAQKVNNGAQASNESQRFDIAFGKEVRLAQSPNASTSPWETGMRLVSIGRGEEQAKLGASEMEIHDERVEMRRAALTEWYVNKPEGLEQGFTVYERPGANSNSALQLVLQLSGNLRAEVSNNNEAVWLKDKHGRTVLSYDHLVAWDANRRLLPAKMHIAGQMLTLAVDDHEAVYPLTIDPLFAQTQKLIGADGKAFDYFGAAVALSGNTVIIGSAGNRAVYAYTRSGNSWSLQAKFTVTGSNDNFGSAVALDSDTAVIGASTSLNASNAATGAVYVFVRNGVNWNLQQKLTASDASADSRFGEAVAIYNHTLIAGARSTNNNGGFSQGAAYVFTREGTVWSQQQKLVASDGANNDQFGTAVAINAETALIGAPDAAVAGAFNRGAAYAFTRQANVWSQQQKLVAASGAANDYFGAAVAISGDTALIGAYSADINGNTGQGAAFVYKRNGTTWSQQTKLTASDGSDTHLFGIDVALSGNVALVGAYGYDPGGAPNQGAAYVFVNNGASWSQRKILHALDQDYQNHFGQSVALSGNLAIIGAPFDTIGNNSYQGSVYSFEITGPVAQSQKLSANDGQANAEYGYSLAVHNNTAVVGAHKDLTGAGSVYVFVRNGLIWSLQQKLTPADGAADDNFGAAVSVYRDTVIIGAPFKKVGAALNQGAAYVFVRNGTVWSPQQKLLASDGGSGDGFGCAVALYEDMALIGANGDTVGANNSQGAAFVFKRTGATWSQQQKLTASDGNSLDQFGDAVALYGNVALIGAPQDSTGFTARHGSAYVFVNPLGTQWSQAQKLTAQDGGPNHYFGSAVALDNYTALVGAYGHNSSTGAAYVYAGHTGTWTLQQELFAVDGKAGDEFGHSVALFGDFAALGAPLDDTNLNTNNGAAYLFERQNATWNQLQKLTAADASSLDALGRSVAIAGPEVLVGANGDDIAQTNQGAVYYYRYSTCPAITLSPAALPAGSFNSSYTQQFTASGGAAPYQFEVSSGVLPRGLSLSNSGLLLGTPSQAGTFNFTVTARTEGLCAGSQNYTLTIGITCATLTINPSSLPLAQINQPYNQTLAIPNGTAPFVFKLFGALPPGLALNLSTGQISGTPTTSGVYQFQVAVTDFNGCEGLRAFMLDVSCPTITINPATLPAATVGNAYNQPLSATGGAAPYTFSFKPGDGLPQGLSLVNGTIAGTPANQSASFVFGLIVTDANGCKGSRTYELTINPKVCPTITLTPPSLPAGTVGAAYSQSLTASGGTAPYTFSLSAGNLPPGLQLNVNTLSGTPSASGITAFTVKVTDSSGCQGTQSYSLTVAPAAVASVSAASYKAGAAPESIVAAFGVNLSSATQAANIQPLPMTLANVSVRVKDSFNVERLAPLFFVSPAQINYLVPQGTAQGAAMISVLNGNAVIAAGSLEITNVAAGLFAANANGQGVAAAIAFRLKGDGTQSFEPVAQFNGSQFVTQPIDLGPASDSVFLVLYGTGIRYRQNLSSVTCTLGNVTGEVLFAGAAPGFTGLDQVNVRIPRTLIGRNEIDIALMAEGKNANIVRVNIR